MKIKYINVGKYASPMDAMGYEWLVCRDSYNIQ